MITSNLADTIPSEEISKYRIIKVLGQGGEGTVYLLEDRLTAIKYVLKTFHEAHEREWYAGLIDYSEKIVDNELGLSTVSLFYRDETVIGLIYPYIPTIQLLHWRILHAEEVAKSIVGSICQKQYYLISKYGIALSDTKLDNLGVDNQGIWHYLDMGAGISKLSNRWLQRTGAMGYGFAKLLLSIYDINISDHLPRSDEYSYDTSCIYWQTGWFDTIAAEHTWIQEILDIVRNSKATIFYEPEFYQLISNNLPSRLPLPLLSLTLSETLVFIGRVRRKLKSVQTML